MAKIPTMQDIEATAYCINAHIIRTPLLQCAALDAEAGGHFFLKAECLQRTGSFKIRGATNRLLRLSDTQRRKGVVAWSSGNHAQGVAAAAQLVGTTAKIVMPSDAPQAKIDGTKELGADIVFYDRATEDREAIGHRIAEDEGRVLVPSYDDADIISGQGTVGLEIVEQVNELGVSLNEVLVPVSGGGLIAGVGLALKHYCPNARLYAVEPEGFDDHRRSVASGQRETNPSASGSLCDALLAPSPGALTWAINQTQIDGGYAVNEEDVLSAMAFAHQHLKLKLEPGGAIALAAALNGTHECQGRNVAIILSGGNVDDVTFNRALTIP
jgi:threonine dehydratase